MSVWRLSTTRATYSTESVYQYVSLFTHNLCHTFGVPPPLQRIPTHPNSPLPPTPHARLKWLLPNFCSVTYEYGKYVTGVALLATGSLRAPGNGEAKPPEVRLFRIFLGACTVSLRYTTRQDKTHLQWGLVFNLQFPIYSEVWYLYCCFPTQQWDLHTATLGHF